MTPEKLGLAWANSALPCMRLVRFSNLLSRILKQPLKEAKRFLMFLKPKLMSRVLKVRFMQ